MFLQPLESLVVLGRLVTPTLLIQMAFGLYTFLILVALALGYLRNRKRLPLLVLLFAALGTIAGWSSPYWPSPLVVCAFALAGAATGLVLHFPLDWIAERFNTRSHGEMAGHFIGLVGVLYAIVLGFVVVTAWEQYSRADELSINEQYDAYDLFNTIAFYDYDNTQHAQVRRILASLRTYADGMAGEGQQMNQGLPLWQGTGARYSEPKPGPNPYCTLWNSNPRAGPTSSPEPSTNNDNTMVKLRCQILQLTPTVLRDQAVYASSLRFLTDLSDVRNTRRHHYNDPPLQPEMWTAFIIGGFILVGMLYLVEASSRGQKVRAMAVGAMIGMMWALALIFNYPFSGSSAISYANWCRIERSFAKEERPKPTPNPACPRSSSP